MAEVEADDVTCDVTICCVTDADIAGSIMLCVIRSAAGFAPSSPYKVLGRATLYDPGSGAPLPCCCCPGALPCLAAWWRGVRRTGEGEVREEDRRTLGRPGPEKESMYFF